MEKLAYSELAFRDYLFELNLAESTVKGYISSLKEYTVTKILKSNFRNRSIYSLEPKTELYILQVRICTEDYAWRTKWNAISHLRDMMLMENDTEPTAKALEKTITSIIDVWIEISKRIQRLLREYKVRIKNLDIREENNKRREQHLRQKIDENQNKLKSVERLKNEITNPKRSSKTDPLRILRSNIEDKEITWLKNTTKKIHNELNLGTSNKLVYLMTVMRDLGYISGQKKYYTIPGFLRLLEKWEILSKEDIKRNGSTQRGMYELKRKLPSEGQLTFKGEKWKQDIYKKDKQWCDDIAEMFEKSQVK